MRPSGREPNQLRDIKITRQYTKHAEGSVLVEFGDTRVLCTASVTQGVPKFLKGSDQGWLTAEYGMLPRSTNERMQRESKSGTSGRTQEIQRLIGRSLRAVVDLTLLKDYTVVVDCDVLQADGGTRTASITGACVACMDAFNYLLKNKAITKNPLKSLVASVSVGMYQGTPLLDLDYLEDSNADTDLNVVMTEQGDFIEVQGTAEKAPFSKKSLDLMLQLAQEGIEKLFTEQHKSLQY